MQKPEAAARPAGGPSSTWTRPSATGSAPSARCAHATAAAGGKMVIFGGWNGGRMLNDLHLFQPDTMTWSRPITTGEPPGPRAGHTITAVGNRVFVFGGGDGSHYLNDLHVLDLESSSWSQAYVAGTSPAARSRHTATLIGTRLFIIAGGDDSRVYNDVYVLDTSAQLISIFSTTDERSSTSYHSDATSMRRGNSLSPATMSWKQAATQGIGPSARWGHAACNIGTRLYVHGGHDGQRMLSDLFVLDTESLTWAPIVASASPSPRAGHTLTALEPDRLLLFGGGDGTRILNDLYILDMEGRSWSHPPIIGTAPAARCAHSANVFEGKLIVFGGGDGNRRFKDLYLLDSDYLLRAEMAAMSKKQQLKPPPAKDALNGRQSGNGSLRQSVDEDKTPKDITTWLTSIGMRKYAEKFTKEEIDMAVLPLLTEAHLERMGIPTIGARLHLLAAIAQLRKHTDERSLPSVLATLSEASSQLVKFLNARPTSALSMADASSPRASLRISDGGLANGRGSMDSNSSGVKESPLSVQDFASTPPSLPVPVPVPMAVPVLAVPVPPPAPRAPPKGPNAPRVPHAKQNGMIESKSPETTMMMATSPTMKPPPMPFVPLPAPFPLPPPGLRGP